ncbi:hypothetical protein [Marinobacterium arenosum]|uniref:hypothetical protein n=1 Tax=Marinobacterium arenosum TaxID=2862496 RepID=UPI001C984AF7|nr:hypothetical protein [Marinobacterium arenosum]MBY4678456.1 hypothetical protein [Marinobacterium arenosum]
MYTNSATGPLNTATNSTTSTGNTAAVGNSSNDQNQDDNTAATTRFSSRAEKFAALNKEFSISNNPSFKVTPNFINRLQEYGLISAQDAQTLGFSDSDDSAGGTLGELSDFIDRFSDKLKQTHGNDGILTTLSNARGIINNFDGSLSKSFPADINTTAAEIHQYLNSNGDNLSDSEHSSLSQLEKALTIADKLNPTSRTSDNINRYMAIAGGF